MLTKGGLMEKRDYETYCSLFQNLSNFMKTPNLIVHLDVTPSESLRRIRLRNRDCEKGITLEYLVNLSAAYQEFLLDISKYIGVIRVNWDEYQSPEELALIIKEEYLKMRLIHVAEEDRILKAMNKMQMKEALNTTFSITNQCFEACINNMRIRKLDNDEELCVYKCIDKNEKFAMLLAEHFAKISQADPGM
eukprot:gene9743-11378_t